MTGTACPPVAKVVVRRVLHRNDHPAVTVHRNEFQVGLEEQPAHHVQARDELPGLDPADGRARQSGAGRHLPLAGVGPSAHRAAQARRIRVGDELLARARFGRFRLLHGFRPAGRIGRRSVHVVGHGNQGAVAARA
nr:hypothetical protein [Pseudonocardia sp. KRD291]